MLPEFIPRKREGKGRYLSMVGRVVVAFVPLVDFAAFLLEELHVETVLARVDLARRVGTFWRTAQNLQLILVEHAVLLIITENTFTQERSKQIFIERTPANH